MSRVELGPHQRTQPPGTQDMGARGNRVSENVIGVLKTKYSDFPGDPGSVAVVLRRRDTCGRGAAVSQGTPEATGSCQEEEFHLGPKGMWFCRQLELVFCLPKLLENEFLLFEAI